MLELVRRLVERQQRLLRHQQLLLAAVEEVWRWVRVPPEALPLNVNIHERRIWEEVARKSLDNTTGSAPPHGVWASDPQVLLRPDPPRDLREVEEALPGEPESAWAGFRRRAWMHHVANLFEEGGRDIPTCTRPEDRDRSLLLTQARGSDEVSNWQALVPRPLPPRAWAREGHQPEGHQRDGHQRGWLGASVAPGGPPVVDQRPSAAHGDPAVDDPGAADGPICAERALKGDTGGDPDAELPRNRSRSPMP